MNLYHFLQHYYNRTSRLNSNQKRLFAAAISQTEQAVATTIDQRNLHWLARAAANPRGELTGKFLGNALHILSGQALDELLVLHQEIDVDGIIDIEFFSILNPSRHQLIVPSYGRPAITEDPPVLCSLIENFSQTETAPTEYVYWDLSRSVEPIVIPRNQITPVSRNEIVRKATELMPPPNFPFGPTTNIHP